MRGAEELGMFSTSWMRRMGLLIPRCLSVVLLRSRKLGNE